MTICLAAISKIEEEDKEIIEEEEISEDEEVLILGMDKMITLDVLGSFEHPARVKLRELEECKGSRVVMLAGYPHLYKEILAELEDPSDEFIELCSDFKEAMEKTRDKKLEGALLNPVGIEDKENIWKKRHPQRAPSETLEEILKRAESFNLETRLLLTGFDEDGKAQIADVYERRITHNRRLNYSAIGSGVTQALNTLLFQEHSKKTGLRTGLYNVFKAKKNSEAHKGVGEMTDMFLLTQNSGLTEVSENDLETLYDIYKGELKKGKEDKRLNNLSL